MAKKLGFEVIGSRAVCVDFRDGRSISFRPKQRFYATLMNASVLRLLRTNAVRRLSAAEPVPALPPMLGKPRQVREVLEARAQVAAAQKASVAKLAASRNAPLVAEQAKPTPAPRRLKSRARKSAKPTENK